MNAKLSARSLKNWYVIALFNLAILALLGLILRYKINFALPFIEQENLLHAHSHFAFNGWIGFLLQLLILDEFTGDYKKSAKFWNGFFMVSTIVNYAMIVSFAWVGYAGISIILSTIALWLSYVFAYKIYKALHPFKNRQISTLFVKASLFFLLVSSLGPYALGIIMATKITHPYWSHNALFFFLHFQYNGWFTFAVLAFLFKKLETSALFNVKDARIFYILLAGTCIPSYLFTSLWQHRPFSITIIIVITAILQTAALYFLWKLLYKNMKNVYSNLPAICRWLYSLAISAFILKVLLQFFSVHPAVTQLSFGFRPIIIGYLHLIFLAFISMFLLGLMTDKKILSLNYNVTPMGLITFAAGIILNELLLAIQGFAAIHNLFLPKLNILLFANTFILVAGAILLFIAARKPTVHSFNAGYKLSNTEQGKFRAGKL
ncbi:hypothetical protein [Segetibacter koreensis]|uniref:hypothetical protein n=1 Tax=Segetibacter koreensis TaxID=398037 RepID=UPI00035EB878|nr:hypothetical protein [Segetibacter koreensis]